MIPLIARQSVIIKCNMQKAVMLGNYEFYYGAGLLAKLQQIEISQDIKPLELKEILMEKATEMTSDDKRERYLIEMIKQFKPDELYDEQMKELFLWGKEEAYLWSVNVP